MTLERWCAERHLADPPTVVARRVKGVDKHANAHVRALLRARPGETILYRRVALSCGGHVLSRADNWYRPERLTAAMNHELQTTDRPFGLVVKPLKFHRERREDKTLAPGGADVLRHEALLETPDGTPFSLVVETYTRAVLDAEPSPSVGQKLKP
ncbi:MAG: hypothetical protein ACREEW_16740 [Caulobacteraceae bacterium]